MYRKTQQELTSSEAFELPFEGKLSEDNRWVIMAKLVPWSEFEEAYAQNFSQELGAPAKSFRMALGALIIKEKLGTSDRETVEQIRENPYLQYFLGMSNYTDEEPFDSTMFVYFRERINVDLVKKVNLKMVINQSENLSNKSDKKKEGESESENTNKGKLVLDATCAPADITYPTDLGLLNKAREQTEKIIDILYNPIKDQLKRKPRTNRKIARKDYLKVAKKRRATKKERRKAIKKQLKYIQKNLAHIEQLIAQGACLKILKKKKRYKMLLVITELYRQQLWLYENQKNSIENRIVSLSQPHIRPIIRGKARAAVEFGAKLSVSYFDKFVFLDKISWDNFNESGDLKVQVEAFKTITGYYPESLHADKIYRTRENREWCKERGIRLSGPPLGRPPKNVSKEDKKQAQLDESFRNCIEGKFGEGKRRYSLNKIMSKLPNTSETSIAITFLVMNLSALLRQVFFRFFQKNPIFSYFSLFMIKKSYDFCN
jgi:transposase, IS5 family